MRTTLLVIITQFLFLQLNAQTLLKMEQLNGIQVMPCKVNGLTLKFIIDTGEKEARLSVTDAMFMLKNGYINMEEITGTEYDRMALGHIGTGTTIKIKQLEIGNTVINNVIAIIDPDLRTPLVLGQSVLFKIGKIEFDYSNQLVTIRSKNDFMINAPTASLNNGSMSNPVNNTSAVNPVTTSSSQQKMLVKVKTSLYNKPGNGYSILQVNSNSFVNLIGEDSADQNFVYVDYMGRKGYINRLALEPQ